MDKTSDQIIHDNIVTLKEKLTKSKDKRIAVLPASERNDYARDEAAYVFRLLKQWGEFTNTTTVIDAGSGKNLLLNKYFQRAMDSGDYQTDLKFIAINLAENTKKYMDAFSRHEHLSPSLFDILLRRPRRHQLVPNTWARCMDLSDDGDIKELLDDIPEQADIIFLHHSYEHLFHMAKGTDYFHKTGAKDCTKTVRHIMENLLRLLKKGGILIVDDIRPPLTKPKAPNAGTMLLEIEKDSKRKHLFKRIRYLGEENYPVFIVQKA